MSCRNEPSSLVALRELRDMERQRFAQAEAARAQAEQERQAREEARQRAEEEQRARQQAERRATEAREAAESTRLRRELEQARREIAELLARLERASLATDTGTPPPSVPLAPPVRGRWLSWLGLSAGASMLVGALALTAALAPRPPRVSSLAAPAPRCPDPLPAMVLPSAASPAVAEPPAARPVKAPRPRPSGRPHSGEKPPAGPVCDGTDPLCGLPLGALDDFGKKRRNQEKRTPR